MGNLLSRAINYMFPKDEMVYSRELQIILPVTQNDIYDENKNKIEVIKIKPHEALGANSKEDLEILEKLAV